MEELLQSLFSRQSACACSGEGGIATYANLLHNIPLIPETSAKKIPVVATLLPPGPDFVRTIIAVWMQGGILLPLSPAYPASGLVYFLEDAGADCLIYSELHKEKATEAAEAARVSLISLDAVDIYKGGISPCSPDAPCLMLYTSGTTGNPKGVPLSRKNIAAQVTTLIHAWEWQPEDKILHVLPLNHTHGLINALLCPLFSGAEIIFLHSFDEKKVWQAFQKNRVSVFMAVPAIYIRLIRFWEESAPEVQSQLSESVKKLRLMVSGSAALPVQVLEKWKSISGQILLERYGMTETGMMISNPLHGDRRAGTVGVPLPGVEIRLVEKEMGDEIQVRGDTVFAGYWNKPEASAEAFQDGWFRTGDIAVVEEGYYRLLGRSSADIIKSGGYKISAVEIEEKFRQHPAIAEIAVLGIPDEQWGERVAAVVILRQGMKLEIQEMRDWAKAILPAYKIPSLLCMADDFPRNQMGKVEKKKLRNLFSSPV